MSYQAIVEFDTPSSYWRMDDDPLTRQQTAVVGSNLVYQPGVVAGVFSRNSDTAINGDRGYSMRTGTGIIRALVEGGEPEDFSNLDALSIEFWFRRGGTTTARTLFAGPTDGAGATYMVIISVLTSGAIEFRARNSAGTTFTATSAGLANGSFNHIVCVAGGSATTVYVNGAASGTAASWTAPFGLLNPVAGSNAFELPPDWAADQTLDYDEVAIYRFGLPAARIAAHYEAGRLRGFPEQRAGVRVGAILDAVESQAPRRVVPGPGVRDIAPTFMEGQSALEAIRHTLSGENVDAMFFVAKDGTLTFLDASHRTGTSYETVQATFDDDGTDLPYLDLDMDYSESFLYNEVSATRDLGLSQTVSDAASIERYGKRPLSLTGLPVRQDSDALNIATALLAKHKEPFTRVLSLDLDTSTPAVTEAVFRRDIGDRIRIFRTPPGGGARIDQTVWIQKITMDAKPHADGSFFARVKFGVSPV